MGGIIGVLAVRAAWRTAPNLSPLDRDLLYLVAACLLPGSLALGSLGPLLWQQRPARWPAGAWLLLPVAGLGLCWDLVWLDNGVRTGALGKLLGGLGALLGTPAVFAAGIAALGITALRPAERGWFHYQGIVLSLALGVAWGWFIWTLTPLEALGR